MTSRAMASGAAILAVVLAAAAATAQQAGSDPGQWRELTDPKVVVEPFGLTITQLDGQIVYNASGEELGEIEGVLLDAAGQPNAVEVDLGRREVVVPIAQLSRSKGLFATALTRTDLEALPDAKKD